MSIKAKFNCTNVDDHGGFKRVHLSPVMSGSEENKSFSNFTPSGKIELTITNPDAFNQFHPVSNYYVTFEEEII